MHFISLGDHCVVAEILRDIGCRMKSYPFDWIAKTDMLNHSNIPYNIEILKWLLKTRDAKSTTRFLLSDFYKTPQKINSQKIWFPHDEGTEDEIFTKYERRFQRLLEDITQTDTPCIFFMVTRNFYITPILMQEYIDVLLESYHPESKIHFISGKHHEYLADFTPFIITKVDRLRVEDAKRSKKVDFHYIEYDTSKFPDYDFTDFRPNIQKYIDEEIIYKYIDKTP